MENTIMMDEPIAAKVVEGYADMALNHGEDPKTQDWHLFGPKGVKAICQERDALKAKVEAAQRGHMMLRQAVDQLPSDNVGLAFRKVIENGQDITLVLGTSLAYYATRAAELEKYVAAIMVKHPEKTK